MLRKVLGLFSSDLAIDLGTANTQVLVMGKGIVCDEPSVVAVQTGSDGRKVVAFGSEAKNMRGKTPHGITAVKPLKDGVIADFEITEEMLRFFMKKSIPRYGLVRPRVIVSVPYGITEVEKRAVRESAESAGAKEVFLVEEPMAAAVGAGLPISDPCGCMIVDIGGGTTEVAVISMRGIVYSRSVKVGGEKFDEAIVNHVRRSYNLSIGEQTAEQLKISIGSALPTGNNQRVEIRGRDLVTGLPQTIEISEDEVREALQEPLRQVLEAIRNALERTPPELSADIIDRGITLTGGGALLTKLDALITRETGLPASLAESPMTAVVVGSGKILEQPDLLREISLH